MADRYWVGGDGNWSDTNRWAASSGGTPGASVPTSADNVIFDAASNVGTGAFTVTVDGTSASPSLCNDFSTGGAGGALDGAMTLSMGATAQLDCYGSMTLPATNFTWTGTSGAVLLFRSTSTGKTVTTNGVSLTSMTVNFNGVGGEWTLGSAYTQTTNSLQVLAGTFNTGNYSLTIPAFAANGSATRSVIFGSSAITVSAAASINITATTNLTFNAGTSTITCSAASPTFTGGGLTFYNVTFSSAASGTTTITGANTFNDLTQTSRSATGRRTVDLGDNQTVSGTLTLGAANTAIRRILIRSSTIGTRRTITLNGSLATLADVDFRDIGAAGSVATPWTGTRLGNCLNNNNITFDAPKTVYWNLAGTQNWSATGWATTNNGVPAVSNFPLAQDTATFTEAGSAGTITFDQAWQIGSIQMADGVSNRTTAFTLATGAIIPSSYGNVTLFSNLTLSGTGQWFFVGQGTTQTITSAGISFTQPLVVESPSGTFQLADNLTNTGTAFTLTSGTLDLDNNTLTCVTFNSNNSNTRSIAFGTSGQITVTGNNTTVWNIGSSTGFTTSGTQVVNCNYSGSVGTRTISNTSAITEANQITFNVTAGTDIVTMSSGFKSINFTGFTGTLSNSSRTIYGNLIISSGMTVDAGTGTTTFAATSGTQQVTTNGKTLDFPVQINAPGATVQLQDNLTIGSTRALTLTAGSLDIFGKTLSTGTVTATGSTTRVLAFGSNGTLTVTGSGASAYSAASTGMTVTGTGTINMASASAKTFAGGGLTYPTLNQSGAGELTISGANTFTNITNTNATASTIKFPASTVTSVKAFSLSGSAGNLVSMRSTTDGTQYTIQLVA